MKSKIILLGFVLTVFISLFIGVYHIGIKQTFLTLLGLNKNGIYKTIIFQIRLPRIIMAALIGGGLSVCGASYQAMFKNPLASPDILGVAFGSAFGAALGILLNFNLNLIQLTAFVFGIIAVIIVVLLSKKENEIDTLSLIISGIVIGTFFSSLIGLIKYIADTQNQLPQIVFWMLGSFSNVGWNDSLQMGIIFICFIFLYFLRWQLNIISLSETEAKSLGCNTTFLKLLIIFLTTLLVSTSVSTVGIVGWVGLVSPHIVRMLTGADNTKVIPISFLFGGTFLIIADDFSRSITSGEIPIGIITSFIGAPVFIFIYKKTYRKLV